MGYKQETINSLVDKAKRYQALKLRAEARLSKYGFVTVLMRWRFSGIRNKIKHYRWLMAAYTMMSVAAVRKNKMEERARKRAWQNL